MGRKITREVLESYLHCKTKAHLKLAGQQGIMSDYEALLLARRQEVRQQAIAKILARHAEAEVPRDIPLTVAALRSGQPFVLDATLEDDLLSLVFDGLKRVAGASKLGDFHYVPMLFHGGQRVGKEQKLLLQLYGLLLSQIQGQVPSSGMIWHGSECRTTRVRLNADLRKSERLLREVKEVVSIESPPRLFLNRHCQICEFRQRCHEQAVQEDNLSLLRGLGEKEIIKQNKKGVVTVTQYSYTFRLRRRKARQKVRTQKHCYALNAMAIRSQTIYVHDKPNLPTAKTRLYLDVEGKAERSTYYLIGLLICEGSTMTPKHYWANTKDDEAEIWRQLMEEISHYDDFILYHYGSYERRFLAEMNRRHGCDPGLISGLNSSACNVLSLIYSHVYFPAYSNGLKDIAAALGFRWSSQISSGIETVAVRERWEQTREAGLKQELVLYNQEDCLGLKTVVDSLEMICEDNWSKRDSTPYSLKSIEGMERDLPRNFKRNEFVLPELKKNNKCSYFEYQRERVYFRTSQSVRKSLHRKKRCQRRAERINKEIECDPPQCCPKCNANHFHKHNRISRVVRNVIRGFGGIKRWVVRLKAFTYECQACGSVFTSPSYRQGGLCHFGWEIVGWTVYQNIALLRSHGSIDKELSEVYHFRIRHGIATELKKQAALRYKPTYQLLIEKLRRGEIAHVDETKVSIKGVTGYVWAFANMEEVIYAYSDTREGDILSEILADFKGVLISDFYAAYDSVGCPQQKCLIHFVRDINDDLHSHPFDEEFKRFAAAFTALLVPIIETIDRHGLKKHYLHRHRVHVDRFLEDFLKRDSPSEITASYQRRIEKCGLKLFTFLDYDGVPWNNNNAEHAIKRFVFLREVIGGSSTENGIKDYLVLLSITETLRLRHCSPLDYFLSGSLNVDEFVKHHRTNL